MTGQVDFILADRIRHFLRPMSEGGMGGGRVEFIIRCLAPRRADVVEATCEHLIEIGHLRRCWDAELMLTAEGRDAAHEFAKGIQ